MDKQHGEREELKEGPKTKIHLDSHQAILKNVPNWKTPDQDSIHGY